MTTRGTFTKKLKKKKKGGLGVGTSMILVVFVLFCLITFAALSYVTARADYIKSEAASQSLHDYYASCSRIEEQLAGIDYENNTSKGTVFAFEEKIDDYRTLYVKIICTGEKSNPYNVMEWTTSAGSEAGISIEEPSGDGLNLLF